MPQNIGYLTADKTTAGDERFTPPITQWNLCLNSFRPLIPALLSGARLMNLGLLTFKPSGQTVTTWCTVLWLPARTSSPASPLTGTL